MNILQTVVSSFHLSTKLPLGSDGGTAHTQFVAVRGLLRTLDLTLRKYRLWSSLTAD